MPTLTSHLFDALSDPDTSDRIGVAFGSFLMVVLFVAGLFVGVAIVMDSPIMLGYQGH